MRAQARWSTAVVVQRMLITRDEPAEILEPRKERFDLPPAAIAPQGPTILGKLSAVPTMRRDHLETGLRRFSSNWSES